MCKEGKRGNMALAPVMAKVKSEVIYSKQLRLRSGLAAH